MTRTLLLAAALLAAGCPKAPQKGGTGLPHPMVAATADYVGFTTAVDGSASTDPSGRALSYAWHFSSVPPNSTVTDAAFADGSAAMTTFMPDLGGAYGVTLVVSTADGATNQVTKQVMVPTAPIFYLTGDLDSGASELAAGVIRSDGTGAHNISCSNRFDLGATDNSTGDKPPQVEFLLRGLAGIRAWDGAMPKTIYSRVEVGANPDHWITQLFVGNDQTDCATRPAIRVDVPAALGLGDWKFYFMRFSPDGKRIVGFSNGSTANASVDLIFTVGADGSGFRVVRTLPTSSDNVIGPAWVDNTHVAWRELIGTANPAEFRIMTSVDAAGAGDTSASTLIDCPAGAPFAALSEFDFADPTTIIFAASTTQATGSAPGTTSIYRESPGSCTTTNKLTPETTLGQFSGDFTLSPDGKTLVYASTAGTPPTSTQGAQVTDIFTVPVDGSAPPTLVGGDAKLIDNAPRFIANGRQIVWTQLGVITFDGGSGGGNLPTYASLMMANADGTGARMLVAGANKPNEVHYVFSGSSLGNTCAIGGNAASAGAIVVLALALMIGLARRRLRG